MVFPSNVYLSNPAGPKLKYFFGKHFPITSQPGFLMIWSKLVPGSSKEPARFARQNVDFLRICNGWAKYGAQNRKCTTYPACRTWAFGNWLIYLLFQCVVPTFKSARTKINIFILNKTSSLQNAFTSFRIVSFLSEMLYSIRNVSVSDPAGPK